jgi:hypothetical protein
MHESIELVLRYERYRQGEQIVSIPAGHFRSPTQVPNCPTCVFKRRLKRRPVSISDSKESDGSLIGDRNKQLGPRLD